MVIQYQQSGRRASFQFYRWNPTSDEIYEMESVASLLSESFDSPSTAKCARDEQRTHADLNRVNQQIEVYKKKLAKEKHRLESLNEKIVQHETKLLERKRWAGGECSVAKIEAEKNIYIDRLNKKLVTLNTKISQNKELRRKIDKMRQDRCRYDEIYTRLEHAVQSQAEQMTLVLEEGKKTIKQRDKALSELDAARKHLEESRSSLSTEQEELRKLEEQLQHEQEERAKHEERKQSIQTAASQLTAAEEGKSEAADEFDNERLLDDALAKVFELTGINNVDTLIKRLIQTEEINFGLFGRINELEAEAAENETRISDAERELKRVQHCGINDDTQRRKELLSMDEKRAQLEGSIQDVDARYEARMSAWNRLRSRILTVHEELGLSVPEDLIGTNSVTENNAMEYLAAIEHKTSQILSAFNGHFEAQEMRPGTPLASSNKGPLPGKTHAMELPSSTNDEDDDGERPLTMEELQESLRVIE